MKFNQPLYFRSILLFLTSFFLLISPEVSAQEALKPGFAMLEKGDFAKAAVFFKEYLKEDPDNRTALLCYGRGIGLSGDIAEAQRVFDTLANRYPNNYEIELNIAESYMWAKKYPRAVELYKDLVETDSTSFAAQLGYANALSENKRYTEALQTIEKALTIQPGNASAMLSRKFMRLGRGSELLNLSRFDDAIHLYDLILEESPKDFDALVNKAQVLMVKKNYKEAQKIYFELSETEGHEVVGLLGLSQVANNLKDLEKALELAEQAVEEAGEDELMKASLGKVDALGWNKRFREAFVEIERLEQKYPEAIEVQAARGRINIWNKDYEKGAQTFLELLKRKPDSFDGNLGYADARHAQGMDSESFEYVRKTLGYYPCQRDAEAFLDRLHLEHDPAINTQIYFSKDNGGNTSQNYRASVTIDPHPELKTYVEYYQRKVNNQISDDAGRTSPSQVEQISFGLKYRLSPTVRIGSMASYLKSSTLRNYVFGELFAELKAGKYQIIELKYNSELQSFNADLIKQDISFQNYTLTYNLSTPFKVGVYSQLIHTAYSDKNTRNLIFASLYYDLKASPVIKGGVNFNYFTFARQIPEIYFSPERFRGLELFGALENINEREARFLYQLQVAGGYQQINTEDVQSMYRFSGSVGIRLKQRFEAFGYYMKSNSAASSVMGFTYQEYGIKAKYILGLKML